MTHCTMLLLAAAMWLLLLADPQLHSGCCGWAGGNPCTGQPGAHICIVWLLLPGVVGAQHLTFKPADASGASLL